MPIKLVVFDIAGTTVKDENYVAHAFRNAFVKNGYDVALEQTYPYMGVKKIVAVNSLLAKIGGQAADAGTIHTDFTDEMMDFYLYDPAVLPLPYTEDVFQQLKEHNIRIALNTGFPRVIADTIMQRLQWKQKGWIDDMIASDEVEHGRPQPYMIQELMRRAGITDATEVAKIGDTEVDVNEGRNAGCGLVVAVTTGAYTAAQLAGYDPDHIIPDLSILSSLILSRD
ncbi:MAG: phosphonoacetaldehyde hydrolase [Citrobacter freundii]|nr:MAG: phosphonoacetaldehyde hydrolase [Citrobacter freundii]